LGSIEPAQARLYQAGLGALAGILASSIAIDANAVALTKTYWEIGGAGGQVDDLLFQGSRLGGRVGEPGGDVGCRDGRRLHRRSARGPSRCRSDRHRPDDEACCDPDSDQDAPEREGEAGRQLHGVVSRTGVVATVGMTGPVGTPRAA